MSRSAGRVTRSRRLAVGLLPLLLAAMGGHAADAQRHPIVWIPGPGTASPGAAAAAPAEPLGLSVGGSLDDAAARDLAPGEVYLFSALSAPGDTAEEIFARLEERVTLLRELYPGFDRPYLVGTGHGGLLAAAFAARRPTLVEGAVAIGSPLSAGVADTAARLKEALSNAPVSAREQRLLDSWTEFARHHEETIRGTFPTRPPSSREAGAAAYGLVRAAWGWSDETLSFLAELERELTGTVGAEERSVVPLPVLPQAPPTDPVARLLVLAAEALTAPPGTDRLRPPGALTESANGVLSFAAQLPADWPEAGEPLPVQLGFAIPGERALEIPLPSGNRTVRLPPLAAARDIAPPLRAALASLGWRPWRATSRDAAVDVLVCREAGEEALDVAATLALLLHPSSPVLSKDCIGGVDEVRLASLAELAGLEPAGAAAGRSASAVVPDLVIADDAAQAAGSGVDLSVAGGILLASRAAAPSELAEWVHLEEKAPQDRAVEMMQKLAGWEILGAAAPEAGGADTSSIPVDDTVRDLLILGSGGSSRLLLGERELGTDASRLALERPRLDAIYLPRPAAGWLAIEGSPNASGDRPRVVLARAGVTSSLALQNSAAGVAASACLRAEKGSPKLDGSSVWLQDGDRSYPVSSVQRGSCLEIRGRRFEPARDGRLNVRLAGTTPGGFPLRRLRSVPVAASGRAAPRPRPVELDLPEAEIPPLPPARAPLASVVIETIEEHLLIFDEGAAARALEPYRDRRVVVALEVDPQSWTIGRYFHQVLRLDLLEMSRRDPFLSRLADGTAIRLYDQQDYLWNSRFAWTAER